MKKRKTFVTITIIILFCMTLLYLINIYNNSLEKKHLKKNEKYDLIGDWIADGTQSQILLEVKEDGTRVYADDYSVPYELSINDDGTYHADFHNKAGKENGRWKILSDYDQIVFTPNNYPNERELWHCEIESDSKITICMYADSFSKIK